MNKCLDDKCQLEIVSTEDFRGMTIYVCPIGHRTAHYVEENIDILKVA